jgi:hypothetical protein
MLDREIEIVTPDSLVRRVVEWAALKPESRPVPVLLCDDGDRIAVRAIGDLRQYCKHYRATAVVVLDQDHVHLLAETGVTEESVVVCGRWTVLGLRAWDHALSERAVRQQLIHLSSGWPDLVEDAIRRADSDESREQILHDVGTFPRSQEDAQNFLARVGLQLDDEARLRTWADLTSDPGEVVDGSIVDLAALDENDVKRLLILGVIDRESDGLRLDPVVQRCLARLP